MMQKSVEPRLVAVPVTVFACLECVTLLRPAEFLRKEGSGLVNEILCRRYVLTHSLFQNPQQPRTCSTGEGIIQRIKSDTGKPQRLCFGW